MVALALAMSLAPVLAGRAPAGASTASPPQVADAAGTVWLCRPGLADDPCTSNISTASVAADGATTYTRILPAKNPKIDCFYVYPTVSPEPTPNADLTIQSIEVAVADAQAAPFSRSCRVYAPMYRQLTLQAISGHGLSARSEAAAYTSLLSDWLDYLAHYNHGRGFVLIGHSQGAAMLIGLIRRQVDANPALRKHLVSAILLGGNVTVPVGKSVGGDFAHVPACRAQTETGCVVAYSSFDRRPPSDTLFGRPRTGVSYLVPGGPGGVKGPQQVLCVNPAALATGGPAALSPSFPQSRPAGSTQPFPTGRVSYPGLYTGQCRYQNGVSWLQVTAHAGTGDTRPVVTESLGPNWGLHLVDPNLTMGNLVSLVQSQSNAYRG